MRIGFPLHPRLYHDIKDKGKVKTKFLYSENSPLSYYKPTNTFCQNKKYQVNYEMIF